MSEPAYVGLSRTELLGKGSYYRLIFERAGSFWVSGTGNWVDEAKRISGQLDGSGFGYTVQTATGATPDGNVFMLKFLPTTAGANKTVADLVSAAEDACDRFGLDLAQLRSIAREPRTNVTSGVSTAADEQTLAAASAARSKEQDQSNPFDQLIDKLKSLGSVVYWGLILLVVALVIYAGYRVYRVAEKVPA